MKKLMLVIFAVMILFMQAGCSGQRIIYNKPGLTTNEFNRDKYACIQQSQQSWSAGGSGAAGGLMIIAAQSDANIRQQALFRMCMEARGYTANIEAEETDEERDRKKIYFTLATELNTAQKEICKKEKFDLLFKKHACVASEINIQQLTDKSLATEEEKASLLKFLAERNDITVKMRKLAEMTRDPNTKKDILLRIETIIKDEQSAVNLLEGKICWADYNKIRNDNLQIYRDAYKQIYSK